MIYDCKCKTCGKIQEIVRSVEDRNDTPICCGNKMVRIITLINIAPDLNFVTADITGQDVHITSSKQHDRLCHENGVAPMGRKGEF